MNEEDQTFDNLSAMMSIAKATHRNSITREPIMISSARKNSKNSEGGTPGGLSSRGGNSAASRD